MKDHDQFEELASLAPLGELSQREYEEFLEHLSTCDHCRKTYDSSAVVAEAAFVVGSTVEENVALADQRYRRARQAIARRLSPKQAQHFDGNWVKPVAAMGALATFVVGIFVVGSLTRWRGQESAGGVQQRPTEAVTAPVLAAPPAAVTGPSHAEELTKLKHEIEATRNEKQLLQQKLQSSDQTLAALTTRVSNLTEENRRQAEEHERTRLQLADAKNNLSQAQTKIQSDQTTIAGLEAEAAAREAQLAEIKGSVDRERQMLSADREIRDIMTARELHMVDVVDTDGKGHVKKAFGRAFYTQGKSLIFYAYDLPTTKLQTANSSSPPGVATATNCMTKGR